MISRISIIHFHTIYIPFHPLTLPTSTLALPPPISLILIHPNVPLISSNTPHPSRSIRIKLSRDRISNTTRVPRLPHSVDTSKVPMMRSSSSTLVMQAIVLRSPVDYTRGNGDRSIPVQSTSSTRPRPESNAGPTAGSGVHPGSSTIF